MGGEQVDYFLPPKHAWGLDEGLGAVRPASQPPETTGTAGLPLKRYLLRTGIWEGHHWGSHVPEFQLDPSRWPGSQKNWIEDVLGCCWLSACMVPHGGGRCRSCFNILDF